eukprot:scaffold7427_cov157-Skeletonema_marinoi.AAC.2
MTLPAEWKLLTQSALLHRKEECLGACRACSLVGLGAPLFQIFFFPVIEMRLNSQVRTGHRVLGQPSLNGITHYHSSFFNSKKRWGSVIDCISGTNLMYK